MSLLTVSKASFTTTNRPTKRGKSLAEEVVAQFTQRIRDDLLSPGDKLPTETVIMAETGVSRTVVREALSRLQAAGLVETRHGVGTFVLCKPNESQTLIGLSSIDTLQDLISLMELRIGLEVEAAGLAAQRRNYNQIKELEAALKKLREREKLKSDATSADFQFHYLIAQATGNKHYTDILNHLGTNLIPKTRIETDRVNHEHEDIFAAIARGDAEAARAAMRVHLSNSRERFRKLHAEMDSHTE
jgi:GntR family transcriptional repressor for pyruvate dehydrogenase complex